MLRRSCIHLVYVIMDNSLRSVSEGAPNHPAPVLITDQPWGMLGLTDGLSQAQAQAAVLQILVLAVLPRTLPASWQAPPGETL